MPHRYFTHELANGRAALTQVEVRVPLASFLLDGDVPAYYGS